MSHVLRKISLFNELTESELKCLEHITVERRYKKNTFVFVEGSKREAVFFIKIGVVKVYKVDEVGNEQIISLLKEGDMFPHVGFFDDSPYPATAEVVQDSEQLMIRIEDFEKLLIENPKIAIKVMKIMGKKILDLQQRLQELISGDVYQRLAYLLVRLAKEYGEKRKEGIFIKLPVTNSDFANMIGTSRESISRALNQYKKDKLIDIQREGILIYDLALLRNIPNA